jgi:hypothetical protein
VLQNVLSTVRSAPCFSSTSYLSYQVNLVSEDTRIVALAFLIPQLGSLASASHSEFHFSIGVPACPSPPGSCGLSLTNSTSSLLRGSSIDQISGSAHSAPASFASLSHNVETV